MTQKAEFTNDPLLKYVKSHSSPLHPVQQKLIEATMKDKRRIMLGSSDELQLLQMIADVMGAKKTIDIGVYTGYSALTIALVLPDDGKVVACDVDEFAKFGQPYWKEAGVADKIDLHIAPATETLEKLIANGEAGSYDFAFIDADKENYPTYYEMCLTLLRQGGIIALDNVLWKGSVLQTENVSNMTRSTQKMNDIVAKDPRVTAVMLNIGDGTTIVKKK